MQNYTSLFVSNHIKIETYFRLLLPELMPETEKVLYIAPWFVAPHWSDQYNFDTILVKAYTDANYTNSIGNWESYTSPLMVPATGSNTGAAAPRKVASDKMLTLSKEISINPSNYVELRGRERAHALIDELFGKPVNRGANPLEGEVSVRIATPAMSSFSEGFAPRANTLQSGGMEKMPLKKNG